MYKWFRLRTAYRILLFLFTIAVCRAVLVNRTIDSSLGDPVTGFMPIYQPQSVWDTCPGPDHDCNLQLDKAKVFNGTWNLAYYQPVPMVFRTPANGPQIIYDINVTLQFTGVAIWVFFILPNFSNSSYLNNGTIANITLDGHYAGTFSHHPDNTTDLIYNATIFYTSGLANTSHELVIGTQDYQPVEIIPNFLIFDWAIYTVDDGRIPSSQSTSSSTSVAFPSTTTSSTASTTPTPQSSSSKIGVIVGCTLGGLGGLAVIILVLVFLVQRFRRVPPIRNGNTEAILDSNVPPHGPHYQPYYRREIPVPDHEPMQRKAARLRETRQRELDERIQSAQRELDNLRPLQNARSAGDPSAAGPSRPSPELASLRNEMQQLRDRVDYLQAQRESDWAQGLSDEPLPPAYSQLSNNVQ